MAFTPVQPTDPLDQPSHSGLHNQHSGDIEALQTQADGNSTDIDTINQTLEDMIDQITEGGGNVIGDVATKFDKGAAPLPYADARVLGDAVNALGTLPNITVATTDPLGGNDGDLWVVV